MEKKIVEALTSGSIIGAFGALCAMIMSRLTIKERLRNLAGGILFATVMTWILRNSTWSPTLKEVLIFVTGAFIGTYWPEVQELIKWLFIIFRWIFKKVIGKKLGIDIPEPSKTETHEQDSNNV